MDGETPEIGASTPPARPAQSRAEAERRHVDAVGRDAMAAAMRGFCMVARRISPNFVIRSNRNMPVSTASAVAMMTRL